MAQVAPVPTASRPRRAKEPTNATLPGSLIMVRAFRDYWVRTGYQVGFKPAAHHHPLP